MSKYLTYVVLSLFRRNLLDFYNTVFVEQRKKIKKCKRKIIFDKNEKIIKIVMIVQVKLIGKFQTISHATSFIRPDSAEGLSKLLSYKVFKNIESKHTNCNHILSTHSYFV